MSFYDQVYEASRPRETKEEVEDYYRREYPGKSTRTIKKTGERVTVYEWQGKLADDLSNVLGIKRASVMRRYQGARKDKPVSKGQEDEYQLLGESLPPIPPEGGYHIHGTVWVKYSDECVEREIDEEITGDEAEQLAATAGKEMLQAVINYYQHGDIATKGPGECAEPDLTVDPIE